MNYVIVIAYKESYYIVSDKAVMKHFQEICNFLKPSGNSSCLSGKGIEGEVKGADNEMVSIVACNGQAV